LSNPRALQVKQRSDSIALLVLSVKVLLSVALHADCCEPYFLSIFITQTMTPNRTRG